MCTFLQMPQIEDIQKEDLPLPKIVVVGPVQNSNSAVQIWTNVELVFMCFMKWTENTLFRKNTAAIYCKR